ncbi:acrosin-like isoform X5 [Motacilla alba alba]|uniref:acrosin-like isoform X5 n=1 Tax=Motacilla alba alba TaxID=1094192 RepID=UPI0018D52C53|nr:acrosin-like isoform X5 [Motacilla alba alba]
MARGTCAPVSSSAPSGCSRSHTASPGPGKGQQGQRCPQSTGRCPAHSTTGHFPVRLGKQRAGKCWAAAARGSVPCHPSVHLLPRGISMWDVIIGATDLSQPGPKAAVRRIQRLLVHQHYVAATARNDIALLELDQPVECSDYIQLGCVPDASLRVSELKSCYIAGWNFARAQGTGMVLQESKVHLMDMELCNSSRWYAGAIHPRNLCAGYPHGGIDTCQGDSGGPLVCKDNEADYYWLVGLNSWGRGCDRARHPGIYTSTQHFYNWILLQTGLSPAERAGPAPQPVVTSAPEQPPKPEKPEEHINLTPEYSQRPAVTSSGTSLPMAFPHQILVQFRNLVQEFLQFRKDKKA